MFPEYRKYGRYSRIIALNKVRQLISKKNIVHKYLFILSPPYCGSTLLTELIATSPAVSLNNPFETREGQQLPTTRKIMFDHKRRWDVTLDFDWEYIKAEWEKYWDLTKPILLEKSPPNGVRVASINKVFPNAHFILLYRNPYAHCESLIRREKMSPEDAAKFALDALIHQKKNRQLPLNSITISYEDLTTRTEEFKHQLSEFLPELIGVKSGGKFSSHNFKKKHMEIMNLNDEKIAQLNQAQLDKINEVFGERAKLLAFFNYELMI